MRDSKIQWTGEKPISCFNEREELGWTWSLFGEEHEEHPKNLSEIFEVRILTTKNSHPNKIILSEI